MLFKVENEPVANGPARGEPEFFWLCESCAAKMSLRLDADTKVKTVPVADFVPHSPSSVHFVLLERKPGFLLSCLNFLAHAPGLQSHYDPRRRAAYAG
jgi:hypothetical protein